MHIQLVLLLELINKGGDFTEKLKKLFANISNSLKEVYKKFPLTILIVYIVTLIHTFGTDEFVDKFEDNWFEVMMIWGVGSLFIETYFSQKHVKVIGGILTFGIAVGFKELIESGGIYEEFIQRILITYVIVLPIITLYKMIKQSNLELHEYGINIISNFGKCSIIYILANLGILLVLSVFIELILDGDEWDIIEKILILLLGGYYIPSLINVFTDMKQEPGKFIKILVTYVFTPIVTLLIVILYLYIIKITIKGELLKNSIFFILSVTFGTVIPVALLLKNYKDNKLFDKLSKILVYLFIPFIFLQIIAMGIRVGDYGLTASRYMAYILVAFEIVFVSLIIYKKSKYLKEMALFAAFLVIIVILSPFNFIKVPVMSQTARIEKLLKENGNFSNMPEEAKKECKSAYTFLIRNDGKEYMEDKV